ncbi:MAG: hypothetical protein ACYTAF_10585, partial [Planctomycetota bacterium]
LDNEGLQDRGAYTLAKKGAEEDDPPVARFACNISPADTSPERIYRCEGNLARMKWDEIRERYPDFKCTLVGERGEKDQAVDIEAPPGGIWKLLLYLLLGLLVTEMIVAWLFGRAKQ